MKGFLEDLNRRIVSLFPGRSTTALNLATITGLVCGIMTTRPDEIGCDECFEQLHWFAEAAAAGKSMTGVIPLAEDHLARCDDCREEFEALLTALRATA